MSSSHKITSENDDATHILRSIRVRASMEVHSKQAMFEHWNGWIKMMIKLKICCSEWNGENDVREREWEQQHHHQPEHTDLIGSMPIDKFFMTSFDTTLRIHFTFFFRFFLHYVETFFCLCAATHNWMVQCYHCFIETASYKTNSF